VDDATARGKSRYQNSGFVRPLRTYSDYGAKRPRNHNLFRARVDATMQQSGPLRQCRRGVSSAQLEEEA
jgi:hypothetical protein